MRNLVFSTLLFSLLSACNNNSNDDSVATKRDTPATMVPVSDTPRTILPVTEESTEKQPVSPTADTNELTCDFLKGSWKVKKEKGGNEKDETWYFECVEGEENSSFARLRLKPIGSSSLIKPKNNFPAISGELIVMGAVFEFSDKPFKHNLLVSKNNNGLKAVLVSQVTPTPDSKPISMPPETYLLTKIN